MQRSERELHLPLDSGRAGDPEVHGRLARRPEQRRLSDARLTVERENAALSLSGCVEHAVDDIALSLPADQLRAGCLRNDPRSMPPTAPTRLADSIRQAPTRRSAANASALCPHVQ
jgi:hypothetical protein